MLRFFWKHYKKCAIIKDNVFSNIIYSEEFILVVFSSSSFANQNSRKIQISFDKSMLYYLVTLLAKYTSFCFQAMSKLFLKSCTSLPIILKKFVANLSSKQLKNHEIYIFTRIHNHRKYKKRPPVVILHFWSYLLPHSNFTQCLISSFM